MEVTQDQLSNHLIGIALRVANIVFVEIKFFFLRYVKIDIYEYVKMYCFADNISTAKVRNSGHFGCN